MEERRLAIEEGRIANEEGRVAIEEGRVATEEERVAIEERRLAVEEERVATEEGRLAIEEGRVAIEERRLAIEERRLAIEERRLAIEEGRVAIEEGRVAIEERRLAIEEGRLAIEEGRVAIEEGRVAIEERRLAIEEGRVAIEEGRVAIEEGRLAMVERRLEVMEPFVSPKDRPSSRSSSSFVATFPPGWPKGDVWPWIRLLYELFASTLAPDLCAACEEPVPMLTAFCPPCALTLTRAPQLATNPTEPALHAPFLYGGALARAITRFKYQDRPELARPLSAVIVRALGALDRSPDLVVPVPLHPSRLAVRGYNQASLLASPVARALGAPLGARALLRIRDTSQQAKLEREDRLQNLAHAFAVGNPRQIVGRRVLLVDDVRTTGATLRACREALLAGGALEVASAVVARAP